LNRPEKREKAWYIFYVIKPQGGLEHDVCGLGCSNYGNVPASLGGSKVMYAVKNGAGDGLGMRLREHHNNA